MSLLLLLNSLISLAFLRYFVATLDGEKVKFHSHCANSKRQTKYTLLSLHWPKRLLSQLLPVYVQQHSVKRMLRRAAEREQEQHFAPGP